MLCHHHHHDHDHDHVPPIATNASQTLRNQIDFQRLTALNASQPNSELYKVFDKYEQTRYDVSAYVSLDLDEQLILNVPFLDSSVKLYLVILKTSGGELCPKTIKLFKNRRDLDFDHAEETKADFVLNHPQVGYEGSESQDLNEDNFVEHYLPRHVFSNLTHLTFFIQDLHGDSDECRLYYVELRGEHRKLSKDPVVTLYESAANPADHQLEIRAFNLVQRSL